MLLTSRPLVHRYVRATVSSLFCFFSVSNPFDPSNFNTNPTFRIYEPLAKITTIRDSSLSEKKSILHGLGSVLIETSDRSYRSGDKGSLGDEAFLSGRKDGVGSVLEDTYGEEVVWEQRSKDVEAERDRVTSPGFSFSAAGMLIPYHLGVAQLLIEKGYIQPWEPRKFGKGGAQAPSFTAVETTPLAGSSAGAIVSVVIASGSSMEFALEATKKVAEDCRLNGTAFRIGVFLSCCSSYMHHPKYQLNLLVFHWRPQAILKDFLGKFLPDDIHIRSNGRVRVGITQLLWRPRSLLVDHFDSKEDLINAVFASSFIPGYLAARPATIFRNQYCVDGALTLLMPPTSASKTVHVCAFPASRLKLKDVGISPDCSQNNQATPQQFLRWALEPSDDQVIDNFFELGHQDATVWAQQNPVEKVVHDEEIGGSN